MLADPDVRSLSRALEEGTVLPEDALAPLAEAAREGERLGARDGACRALGAIAGRAYEASWPVAERAAFALLELAREADSTEERVLLLHAVGRGFRNAWLMPFVHSCMSDADDGVVVAAIAAAGGLGFPALEETIAATFLSADVEPAARRSAIAALGRMGAESATARLVPFVGGRADAEAVAALDALTEIRSPAGRDAAVAVLGSASGASGASGGRVVAAVRYLAELGDPAVEAPLRSLAREEQSSLRLAASFARRALEAERERDAGERILAALTERDRVVRAALARRLRTLPVADVIEQAEVLFTDDPGGVIQVIAEVRAPEVTRLLLRLAADDAIDVAVRARAAGSIEADEPWERAALVELATGSPEGAVRAAAAQALGTFAPPSFVLARLATLADDPAPAVRGALLWALQLAARPRELQGKDRAEAERLVCRALADDDASVRRRAAYVAGNLDAAALVPDLVAFVRREEARPDLRIAGFVALGDVGSHARPRFADLVHLWNREDDPDALGAASRALERSMLDGKGGKGGEGGDVAGEPPGDAPGRAAPRSAPPSLARVHDRLPKLLTSPDSRVRAAAARVAGLALGATAREPIARLVDDPAPRVRRMAVVALGRAFGAEAEAVLVRALDDPDAAVQERAAEALLELATVPTPASGSASAHVLDFIARTPDRAAALRVTASFAARASGAVESGGHEARLRAAGSVLDRVGHDDPVYEPLLELKLVWLEAARPPALGASAQPPSVAVDDAIVALFPMWRRLCAVRGFAPLGRSLRTAEMLFASASLSAADGVGAGAETDHSAGIVLWMKSLEGYLHAWLAPRLGALQNASSSLWELTERLTRSASAWSAYQRYLDERWVDPVVVGTISVEVPLRSVVNALRDLHERRGRSLDSPWSVTEWSRIMLFLAVDHPAGPKNLLEVGCRDADRAVRLAHKLQVLAQVRNVVTHRSTADAPTLAEFRRTYYAAFEDLTGMA